MSFRVLDEPRENLPKSLRRVLQEQSEKALASLEGERADDEGVHDARKRCKKMRSLVRLARPGLKSGVYKKEKNKLRDTKNLVETLRDREAAIETFEELREEFEDVLTQNAFDHFHGHLQQKKEEAFEDRQLSIDRVEKVRTELAEFRDRIPKIIPDDLDRDDCLDGLEKIYKQGRKRMKKAEKKPSFENLHDWRKRVKDLCYQARLLRNLWPREVKTLAKEANQLGDYLGDDHDFAEMIEYIEKTPNCCEGEEERNALLALIKRRRNELQAKAWPLGRRIYSESPGDFIDRMESYWDALEEDQRLQKKLRKAA